MVISPRNTTDVTTRLAPPDATLNSDQAGGTSRTISRLPSWKSRSAGWSPAYTASGALDSGTPGACSIDANRQTASSRREIPAGLIYEGFETTTGPRTGHPEQRDRPGLITGKACFAMKSWD
jgi:hypothetical protein